MPLQRRLPKRGFKSHLLKYNAEVTLDRPAERLGAAEVDLLTLKQAGLVGEMIKSVKVIKTGELTHQGRAQGHRRDRGRQGGDRGGRRLGRLIAIAEARTDEQWQPTRINWPRAASSATCVAGCVFLLLALVVYRLGAHIPVPGIDPNQLQAAVPGPAGRHPEPVQHVLGRRAVALHRVRARDHAVHLGVDHHAADDLRRADARGAEEGRRVGAPQDHAVHALRHARSGAVPVARHRARARRLARPGDRTRASVSPDARSSAWWPARCS